LCLMNYVADSVLADKADLSEVLSWLYELIKRSTSAECDFAASSRAKVIQIITDNFRILRSIGVLLRSILTFIGTTCRPQTRFWTTE